MVDLAVRQLWKRTLSILRVKLLYSRITLTRSTTFYFFLALSTCIVLSALQGVAFVDNSQAVAALAPLVKNVNSAQVLVLENGVLQTCTSIPNQGGTKCTVKHVFGANKIKRDLLGESYKWTRHWDDELDIVDIGEDSNSDALRNGYSSSSSTGVLANNSGLSEKCLLSLAWLDEIIEDSKREDIVTFLFQLWLFSLAVVTILNESIPHLGAAFFGHVLGTGWAGYRISSSQALARLYRNHIVPEACGGRDLLGVWWDIRIQHSIPIVVVNSIILVAFLYVSLRLYKVYANESFSRVGTSSVIHRIYKIVLLFSVGLQLSGFFSLASSAMWIDKVCHGMMKEMAKHSKLYLAAFVVILVFQFPWLYLGWVCVRKECRIRFAIFCAISAFLLTISTLMFFSPLYRYIFMTWPFFATVTVTAYALNVFTSVLAVVCRLNFGKGLAHYLQVTDALEGVDFTPVSFWKGYDTSDPEKVDPDEKTQQAGQETAGTLSKITLQLPALARHFESHASVGAGVGRQRVQDRGSSIYSEDVGTPIMLSSSPPLISEMSPAPTRLAKAAVVRARSMSQGHIKSQSQSQSLGGSISVLYPPGLQDHIASMALERKEGTGDEDERGISSSSREEISPVSASNPGPSIPPRASIAGDVVSMRDGVLTRAPTRSSSIQSKRSSKRKLMKQGLPANPRARV